MPNDTNSFIPVCEPTLSGRELEYASEAVRTGWISANGKYVKALEEKFAAYTGTKYSVTVSTGTAAVHLALIGAGIKAGDEVIIPNFTMIGSTFPICYLGAKPVFVDCEPDTWNIDPAKIEEKITPRTRAIMPVHIYGHACDMDKIMAIARKHNLHVIEDAAEAIGSEFRGKKCGAFGISAAFSLFANKVITTGEGGMVTTDDKEVYDRCRYFKNLCFPLDGPRNYTHEDIGFNYRMPNTLAAIGVGQLERVNQLLEGRRSNARRYNDRLKDLDGIQLPVEQKGTINSYWMYGIVLGSGLRISREKFMGELKNANIETRAFFVPMHRQPALKKYGADMSGSYPHSDFLSERGFYLPSGSALSDQQIDRVCTTIRKIYQST